MKWLLMTTLVLCGCAPDCSLSEATGLFELFKTEGCTAVSSSHGTDGQAMSFFHGGDKILVDGVDTVGVVFPDPLYVGRRGACVFLDEDEESYQQEHGHCDYVIRSFSQGETESSYTVEFLSGYFEIYGKQGTMKGVMTVQAFAPAGGP
jgi:hypothetical protein